VTTHEAAVDAPIGLFGWALPPGYTLDDPRFEYLAVQLNLVLLEFDASCFYNPDQHASLLTCHLPLDGVKSPTVRVQRAIKEVKRLGFGPSMDWVYAAARWSHAVMLARTYRRMEDNQVSHGDAEVVHATQSPGTFRERHEFIVDALEIKDSQQRAERWLSPDQAAGVVLIPRTEHLTTSTARHHVGDLADVTATALEGVLHPEQVDESIRASAGHPAPVITELGNGLTVVAWRREGRPFVHTRLLMPAGFARAPSAEIEYLRREYSSTPGALVGTTSLFLAPSKLGGWWSTSNTWSAESWDLVVSKRNLESALYMLRERLNHTEVEKIRTLKLRRDLQEQWANDVASLSWRIGRAHQHHLGALDGPSSVSFKELLKVDEDAVQQWQARVMDPTESTLLVVGDFDPEDLAHDVEHWLRSWRRKADATPFPERVVEPAPDERRTLVLDDPALTQAQLMLSCALNPAADRETLDVLTQLVGSQATQRLRTELGATYGIRSRWSELVGGRPFLSVQGNIEPEFVDDAVATILGTLAALTRGEADGDAVIAARLLTARGDALALQTHHGALEMMHLLLPHLGDDSSRADRLIAVDPAKLAVATEPCAGLEFLSIRGPREPIIAALENAEVDFQEADLDTSVKSR